MLLSAQLAFAVQQQQHQQNGPPSPNPFMSAYANLLSNPSLLPSLMSESLKAARFSPYSKPHFNNTTITTTSKVTASLKSIKKNISIKSQQSLSSHKDEELYLDNRLSLSDERLSSRNDNAEDENLDFCKKEYQDKKLFEEYATFRCNSSMYPNMEIIATACNYVQECADGSDEN